MLLLLLLLLLLLEGQERVLECDWDAVVLRGDNRSTERTLSLGANDAGDAYLVQAIREHAQVVLLGRIAEATPLDATLEVLYRLAAGRTMAGVGEEAGETASVPTPKEQRPRLIALYAAKSLVLCPRHVGGCVVLKWFTFPISFLFSEL